MSITDELRRWNTGRLRPDHAVVLDAIADRIDAEHKAKVDEAYENGKRDEYAAWIDDTDGGYIKLPVDADGVPIHVGDELTDEKDRPVKVRVLKLRENGWLFDSSYCCGGMSTTLFRHVQPDSWERIIGDAIDTAFEGVDDESEFDLKKMELVDRCRRLAGEDA